MVKVIGGNAVVAYGVLQLTKVVKSFQLFKRELLVRSFVRDLVGVQQCRKNVRHMCLSGIEDSVICLVEELGRHRGSR